MGLVLAEADLSVTKADSRDPVIVGEDLAYTITIINHGPQSATDVERIHDLGLNGL